ncbi:MAG: carbonic anhydrase [Deltaproteobacteria bacterium]|nr:carbonic anhydrase [Deltaproteobacteria bacterium]
MRFLPRLFENNRSWAAARVAADPDFFERLCGLQAPEHLWIGCADSRVPANEIVGLAPGELFVHRNIANVVAPDDSNCLSVLQYAIDVLKIKHIIVCGHYGCGGVQAAFGPPLELPLESWLQHIRAVRRAHERELESLPDDASRLRRLCELNVRAQVRSVCRVATVVDAWERGQSLAVHGWVYDLHDGLLRDLGVSAEGGAD